MTTVTLSNGEQTETGVMCPVVVLALSNGVNNYRPPLILTCSDGRKVRVWANPREEWSVAEGAPMDAFEYRCKSPRRLFITQKICAVPSQDVAGVKAFAFIWYVETPQPPIYMTVLPELKKQGAIIAFWPLRTGDLSRLRNDKTPAGLAVNAAWPKSDRYREDTSKIEGVPSYDGKILVPHMLAPDIITDSDKSTADTSKGDDL